MSTNQLWAGAAEVGGSVPGRASWTCREAEESSWLPGSLLSQAPAAAVKPGAGAAAGAGGSAAGTSGRSSIVAVPSREQAQALFKQDKDLQAVYEQLVPSGILTEQEFWRSRQNALRGGGSSGGGGSGPQPTKQRAGIPSLMLADVRPSADGQTETVHFQLTPQSIQQVLGGLGLGWGAMGG